MFNEENIIEFINKIINQADVNAKYETQENIRKFRTYLDLTQMCDEETLDKIDKVLDCYDSLMNLKESFGYVDVSSLFSKAKEERCSKKLEKKMLNRQKQVQRTRTENEDKHYHHYSGGFGESTWSSWASSCGGGSFRSGC